MQAVHRIHNFNAGPAALPLPVLEEIRDSFLDFQGTGMSIVEMSHRSKEFEAVLNDAVARTRRMLKLDERYHITFLQGGASLQFAMIPMNLPRTAGRAPTTSTPAPGSTNAIKEARVLNKPARVATWSEDRQFTYIPQPSESQASPRTRPTSHITSNETIGGTRVQRVPRDRGCRWSPTCPPISCPAPSTPNRFGLIYAGAQKNIGPAGVALVILRKDLVGRAPGAAPDHAEVHHLTPRTRSTTRRRASRSTRSNSCLKWLEETVGGLEKMAAVNEAKAARIYRTHRRERRPAAARPSPRAARG